MVGFMRTLGVVACLALAQAQGQVSQVRVPAAARTAGAPRARFCSPLRPSLSLVLTPPSSSAL